MKLTVIQVPYDSGHFGRRMGRGSLYLIEQGLSGMLERRGHEVCLEELRLPGDFLTEVESAVELQRLVAAAVASARADGRLPIVLSGNCNTALGTMAGLGRGTGVLWFDAHGDFNTPDTSPSGFFDGMALSVLTGNCWRGIGESLAGQHPVAEGSVVLIGARDLDPAEERLLDASEVVRLRVEELREQPIGEALDGRLDSLSERVSRIYLHIDLDVLDPTEAVLNSFAAPGGLQLTELVKILQATRERLNVVAVALTAYDPEFDQDDFGIQAAEAILEAVTQRTN